MRCKVIIFFSYMEIFLFSRPQMAHTDDELHMLFGLLDKHRFDYYVNSDFAELVESRIGKSIAENHRYESLEKSCKCDSMVLCYGGDGTFLDGVRLLGGLSIPILGINSGRLGFLANVPKDSMDRAFEDIAKGAFTVEPRSMLYIDGDFPEQVEYSCAFNEFTIQRAGASMISVEAYIDNEMIATYWGDGVLLSTPTGSTAYSLSVGGPIVAPQCDCFILSPIAPHNLTMRPVVLPNTAHVTFKVNARDEQVFATIDNLNFRVSNNSTFRLSKSKKSIFLVKLQNISFYDTLRNKMMWGFDRRDEVK